VALLSLVGTVVTTQHSADAVIQCVPDPEWVVAYRNKTGPSLPGAKGKILKTSKSVGSLASVDAIETGLDPVDADMPAERLSPSAYERTKKARVERGQYTQYCLDFFQVDFIGYAIE
jgi:hypothetical protein